MAITYPLSLPAGGFARIRLAASSVVGESASPFTQEQQVYVHQGQWWEAEVSLPPVPRDKAEDWIAFLLALNGKQGTFLMGDPAGSVPRGVATGAPVVDGAAQSGQTLATRGWTVSVTNIMKAGDWLQLGSGASTRLHKLLAAGNSDGTGKVSVDIWPRLRAAPADGATITVVGARGLWRLSSNRRDWDISDAVKFGITFACREAL